MIHLCHVPMLAGRKAEDVGVCVCGGGGGGGSGLKSTTRKPTSRMKREW